MNIYIHDVAPINSLINVYLQEQERVTKSGKCKYSGCDGILIKAN